jgi:hypothetical protein
MLCGHSGKRGVSYSVQEVASFEINAEKLFKSYIDLEKYGL